MRGSTAPAPPGNGIFLARHVLLPIGENGPAARFPTIVQFYFAIFNLNYLIISALK